jgi:hypothetical protein
LIIYWTRRYVPAQGRARMLLIIGSSISLIGLGMRVVAVLGGVAADQPGDEGVDQPRPDAISEVALGKPVVQVVVGVQGDRQGVVEQRLRSRGRQRLVVEDSHAVGFLDRLDTFKVVTGEAGADGRDICSFFKGVQLWSEKRPLEALLD